MNPHMMTEVMEALLYFNRKRWWTDIHVGYTVARNDDKYVIMAPKLAPKKSNHFKMIPLSVGP